MDPTNPADTRRTRITGTLFLAAWMAAGPAAAGPQLEGRVRLPSGEPAAGAQVRLFDLTDLRAAPLAAATDASGRFQLSLRASPTRLAVPDHYGLGANYPNPFNPSTVIPYQLPAATEVRLEVFNILGQQVTTLVDGVRPPGHHTVRWDATDAAGRAVAAGVYLYRLQGGGVSLTERMVLIDGQAGLAANSTERSGLAGGDGSPVYGLTVSGRGLVPHVDPAFPVSHAAAPVELVVQASNQAPRARAATTETGRLLGDVDNNRRVDLADALLVLVYSSDPSTVMPNDGDVSLGDVNADGKVDLADAWLIATYSIDPTDPRLPAGIGALVGSATASGLLKIYWTDRGTDKIQRSNLDGSEVEDVVTGLTDPAGLVVDEAAGKIYWTDWGTDKIQRANLDGSRVEDVLTELGDPYALALDAAGGRIYWTEWDPDKIRRANLDGSEVEDLVTGLTDPAGLALDLAGERMYWTDWGSDKIQRAKLNGSQVEDLVTELTDPAGLALDVAEGKIYWTDWGSDKIQRSNLDGSQVEDLVTEVASPWSLALDVAGRKVYWSDDGTDKIQRANLDGSQVEDLVDQGLDTPRGIALGGIRARMYWADWTTDKIQRGHLDGSGVEDLVDTALVSPYGMAVDKAGGKVYWTDFGTDRIQRSNLDGSEVEALVTEGLTTPAGIALDVARSQMYWTDRGSDKIQRSQFDGSEVEDLITSGLRSPDGLALDVAGGKMYWTDFGTDRIRRANLDGSQVEDLVTTGLTSPAGLALDVGDGKMYWADFGTDKIQRANLDGSQVEDLVTTGLRMPRGLAVDAAESKVYWADPVADKIQRANLDGSQVEDLVTDLEGPVWVALDRPAELADHGDTRSVATLVAPGSSIQGELVPDDVDYFRVQVRRVGILAAWATGDQDTHGSIEDSTGTVVASNDDSGAGPNFHVVAVVDPGTYYIRVRGFANAETGPYTLHVATDPHGDSREEATLVSVGSSTLGALEPGDIDFFQIDLDAAYTVVAYSSGDLDTFGYIVDGAGTILARDDDAGEGSNFRVRASLQAGTYYIQVEGLNQDETGPYTLEVR